MVHVEIDLTSLSASRNCLEWNKSDIIIIFDIYMLSPTYTHALSE